tara:strand:+ start:318 stop:1061 length:744 start_codon:yes stop_codon:yes gene_type:complete
MIYILLPAFNEYPNLVKILKKVEKSNFFKKKTFVVLVDDTSSDETYKFKNYKNTNFKFKYIKNKKNSGLSLTLEKGFSYIIKIARSEDIIVTLDADNTHPVETIQRMIKNLIKNDVIIASRFVSGSKVYGVSVFRKILSYAARIVFTISFPIKNIKDYTCNFRAYKSIYIKNLIKKNRNFFGSKDFGIAADILIQLNFMNKSLKFYEVPFTLYYNRKIGKSKIKIFKTIYLTLKIIFKNIFFNKIRK